MFGILEDILRSLSSDTLGLVIINLIPFGTKPAAVGMAWFAVNHDEEVIVTFDNTRVADGRSSGVGRIHLTQFC